MGHLFRRLFNLYPGEEKKAFLFASLGFLWALSVTSALKYADALFLIHIGAASLPTAYMLSALGNIAIASFILYGMHTVSPSRLFLIVIVIGMCFYGFAYINLANQIGPEAQWFWFSLKIFGWLFFTVIVTCFWTFIDQYYHLQDAKRLYSLFSSSVFIGLASTGFIMRLGVLDPKHLMIMIVILLALSLFAIRNITQKLTKVPDDNESENGVAETNQTVRGVIQSILSSPFAIFLMTGNLLIQVISVITEYNYLSAFDLHFDAQHPATVGGEQKAALTLFLGQLVAGVSVGNLIFGLFIYSRLVRRVGVSNLVIYTPAALLFLFSGWLLDSSLLFPIIGFIIVEGLMYVIDDCNFTLLLNAVPSKIKYKIRVTIESFFEPIGMLSSAILISFVQVDSKWLGLLLAILSLTVALALRSYYLKGIYQNLSENAIDFQQTTEKWWQSLPKKARKAAEFRMLAIFKQGDETSQLLACEGLLSSKDPSILDKLLQLADNLEISTKIKFVELIEQSIFCTDSRVLDHLYNWLYDFQDQNLRSAIHFYLAKQGLFHPEKAMQDLYSDNLLLQGAAIIALKKSWAHQSPTTASYNRTMAAQHLQRLLDSADEAEICMGLKVLGVESLPQDVDIMLPFLKNDSKQVSRTAAALVAPAIDKHGIRYAPMLIKQLTASSDNDYRLSCLKALGKISNSSLIKEIISASINFRPNERRLTESIIIKMGLRTVPTLLSITKDTTMHDRCRVLASRILGHLALPQLRANLYDIISGEIERAYFYFYHHHTIQAQYPDLDLKILRDSLLTGYHSVIDFIIQLLGIVGSIEDCELLSRSLRSRNIKVRSQVMETLEKTCDPKIFRLLQPLVADLPLDEKLRAYRKGERTPLSLTELLDRLDQSSSLADQIIAATLQYRLDMPNWRESLRQQMPANEEIFHHFAYELLES